MDSNLIAEIVQALVLLAGGFVSVTLIAVAIVILRMSNDDWNRKKWP